MILKAPYPSASPSRTWTSERGAALVTSILILGMLSAVAITVLAVVQRESQIAGSDLKRTQTFYAAAAGIEKMTTDFSALFLITSRPTGAQLLGIQNSPPPELTTIEGYTMNQLIGLDGPTLTAMQASQGIVDGSFPRATVQGGPFNGMSASLAPYVLNSMATSRDGTQVALTRNMNNYLIPIFQFGMFSNGDIELHPGPPFAFNGRVHANGNIYVTNNVTFLSKVTTANELIHDVFRNGIAATTSNVAMQVGNVRVPLTMGSMIGGPNIVSATSGDRGYFPGSPDGSTNDPWDSTSKGPATVGVPNQFGGQLQTRTTGGVPLLLPMQLGGNPTREIIKRRMPADVQVLRDSRFHTKAQIRILIDDESPATTDTAGIPAGKGEPLSAFAPIPLPDVPETGGGGRALWRIDDNGNYLDNAATCVLQQQGTSPGQALTVRGCTSASQSTTIHGTSTTIPGGAGLSGRILIEIVTPTGATVDVTKQILSMGMTVGEPNAIVMLQRPLWAAFTQGSRDSSGGANSLTNIVNNTYIAADGQIRISPGPSLEPTYGYLTGIADDAAGQPQRLDATPYLTVSDWGNSNWETYKNWNSIVPINVYNVREGCIGGANCDIVYERGITTVVELNMRNLARWLDGVYDTNLLVNNPAISTNISNPGGYTVYVSDRRGDKVKSLATPAGPVNSTNGMCDNVDIYGPNDTMDPGEDVQDSGLPVGSALVKDEFELPDPQLLRGGYGADLTMRALTVAGWSDPDKFFRHSVRLFNAEDMQLSGAAGRLSSTQGITISTENMLYTWGNYNTTGIDVAPAAGFACLMEAGGPCTYRGDQIPSSLVCDAIFPLSKTWSDGAAAMYPNLLNRRVADRNLPGVTSETAVRAGVIAGNNLGALRGNPDAGNGGGIGAGESRLNGGMHNFPRFLERWDARWNFIGSLIPLFHSTQAVGQYNSNSTIYGAPIRNWAFDSSFLNPNRLPPSTPQFQYVQPTAFRQLL
jgi:hypothetical protein